MIPNVTNVTLDASLIRFHRFDAGSARMFVMWARIQFDITAK